MDHGDICVSHCSDHLHQYAPWASYAAQLHFGDCNHNHTNGNWDGQFFRQMLRVILFNFHIRQPFIMF